MFIATAAVGGLNTTVTFIGADSTNTNQDTYTSPSFSTLTANARRLVIIGFRETNLTTNNTAPASCTIFPNSGGSISATLIEQNPTAAAAIGFQQIWAAPLPSGTSATVEIARAANMTGQVFMVWIGQQLRSLTAIDSITSSLGNPSSDTIATQNRGFVVGIGFATSASGFSWTNLTENVDDSISTVSYTGASRSKVSGSSLPIELDAGVNCHFLAASWR